MSSLQRFNSDLDSVYDVLLNKRTNLFDVRIRILLLRFTVSTFAHFLGAHIERRELERNYYVKRQEFIDKILFKKFFKNLSRNISNLFRKGMK